MRVRKLKKGRLGVTDAGRRVGTLFPTAEGKFTFQKMAKRRVVGTAKTLEEWTTILDVRAE
jgi:hypothetical protein